MLPLTQWFRFTARLIYLCPKRLRVTHPRWYEIETVSAIGRKLGDSAASFISDQVAYLNSWTRESGDQLVVIESVDAGRRKPVPIHTCFPSVGYPEFFPVAKVTFHRRDNFTQLTVDVCALSGQFAQMLFHAKPRVYFRGARAEQLEVQVDIVVDPFRTNANDFGATNAPRESAEFTGWLAGMDLKFGLNHVHMPLRPDLWKRLEEFYGNLLPEEYLTVMRQANGFSVGPCRIFGLSGIHSHVTSRELLYVLAEVQGAGYFVIVKDDPGRLCYYDHEGLVPVLIGDSFCQAIEKACEDSLRYRRELS